MVLTHNEALDRTLAIRQAHPGRQPQVQPACTIRAYQNQLVRLTVASPASGYLVLSDNHYPGWTVTIDGEDRPLLQANAVVRAVWVEAGAHEVVFRYQPGSWRLGLAITLATLLAGLAMVCRDLRLPKAG